MTMKRKVRCFLFDLGSTLWMREEEGTQRAKEDAYRLAGGMLLSAPRGEIFADEDALALGKRVHKAIQAQIRAEKVGRPEYEPDFALATMRALQQMGLADVERELCEVIFEALRVRIPVSRVLFPDALSTLAVLRQRGYILGVVTNRDYGGQPFREDLQVMGLLNYFEYRHMAISADLGIRKPHPGIFRYALERLGALAEETAMVGDNLEADVGGARQLNMLGIWKPKPGPRIEQQSAQEQIVPDLTIKHLHELLERF